VRFAAALCLALALGLWLQWPSLSGGFRGDDYVQRAMLRGEFPAPRSAFDLFSFAAGSSADYRRLVDFGHLPWWSHPQLRLRMFRPLASGLMALDFTWFDTRAELHHAHSLLWFSLLLWAAARLLWRALPERTAALALLMFASAPCHTLPVGWLANRSTLVGCALAFFAVALHIQPPATRWRTLIVAAVSGMALLCGEYALSALLYGLAFSLCTPGQSWRARLRSALPVLAPIAAYLVLHSLVGSDVLHSGYYVSPVRSPLAFARALVTRVPVLAADLLLGLPSLYWNAAPPWRAFLLQSGLIPPALWLRLPSWPTWHVLIGYVSLALAYVAYRWLRRLPEHQRAPSWLALGAGLSLLPCAGSLPEDRLLVAATLGAYAWIASLLTQAPALWPTLRGLGARVGLGGLWLLAGHVAIDGLRRSYDDVRAVKTGSEIARAFCLDADMPVHDAQRTRVYVLAAADFNTAVNLPWLRLLEQGHPIPRSYRRLSPGPLPLDVTRTGERSLELTVLTSDLRGTAVPSLYRAESAPVRKGERHELDGLRVEVLEVMDDNPERMRFEFDRSLDDESFWLLIATAHGLRRQHPPAIGETLRVPFAQFVDRRAPATAAK